MSERVILDTAPIFRGVRPGHLESGALTYRAFLLCRPDDTGLSVSEIQERALNSLQRLKGTARLGAGEVRCAEFDGVALELRVVPMVKAEDPGYAQIMGLPPYAGADLPLDAPEKIRANQVADALLRLATYEPR